MNSAGAEELSHAPPLGGGFTAARYAETRSAASPYCGHGSASHSTLLIYEGCAYALVRALRMRADGLRCGAVPREGMRLRSVAEPQRDGAVPDDARRHRVPASPCYVAYALACNRRSPSCSLPRRGSTSSNRHRSDVRTHTRCATAGQQAPGPARRRATIRGARAGAVGPAAAQGTFYSARVALGSPRIDSSFRTFPGFRCSGKAFSSTIELSMITVAHFSFESLPPLRGAFSVGPRPLRPRL